MAGSYRGKVESTQKAEAKNLMKGNSGNPRGGLGRVGAASLTGLKLINWICVQRIANSSAIMNRTES
jgi:hypothetical protein